MKTIEEIQEHFKTNHYRESAVNSICLFLESKEITGNILFTSGKGEKTFNDFVEWYESKIDTKQLIDNWYHSVDNKLLKEYIEREFKQIVDDEMKRCFDTLVVNPFDCDSCSCTVNSNIFSRKEEDNSEKIEDIVINEIVCKNLENVVKYLEDLDYFPIHLYRVNETLKLLIDSVEHHNKKVK